MDPPTSGESTIACNGSFPPVADIGILSDHRTMVGGFTRLIAAAASIGSVSAADMPPSPKAAPDGGGIIALCLPTEAKPTDVAPGKIVRTSGDRLLLGTVEVVGADSAVVTGEYGSLRFPLQAFGAWCDGSLLLRMSQRRFKELAKQTPK